jgi:oligopeptidase B
MTKASDLPPAAARRAAPHSYERHGYHGRGPLFLAEGPGLSKVDDEDVLAYLKAENAYFEAAMKPHSRWSRRCSRR